MSDKNKTPNSTVLDLSKLEKAFEKMLTKQSAQPSEQTGNSKDSEDKDSYNKEKDNSKQK